MTRPIPQIAVDFVSQHEGCKLRAYQDSVGVWTIGYGHTSPEVVGGKVISDATALIYLREDLETAAGKLASVVKAEVIAGLTEHQYAALLSFVFNLGAKGSWTIWKRLNAGELDQVPVEMMRFTKAGGRVLQGLVNRRSDEVKLWATVETASQAAPPSSVTRQAGMTPPVTMDKPVQQSKTFWTAAGVAVSGIVTGAQQIQTIALPQIAHSDLIAKLSGAAAVVIVGGGVAIMAFKWLDAHKWRH